MKPKRHALPDATIRCMSASELSTLIDAAVAANEAGNFATALSKLRSAPMTLMKMPDRRAGEHEMRWRMSDIESMIANLKQADAAKIGVRTTKITYVKPAG